MKYLIDTDVLIEHLRKKKLIDKEVIIDGAGVSIISLAELYFGAYKSVDPSKSLEKLRLVLEILDLTTVNLNIDIVDEFARLRANLEKQGQRLDDFDLLIAATAKVNDFILLTGNKRHFERIKGLRLA